MNKKDLDMEKDAALPEESGTESDSMGMAGVTVPAGYNSQYTGQIQQAYQDFSQRQPFSYDINSDAMYEALKNQYISGGQMAMMDTMGQAATLTGGYGNSYAQGAGQQAYQQYLQGLNDQVPDLYQMALENYMAQGDQMLQNYSMLMDMDNMEYGRYMDNMDMIQAQVLEMLRAGHRPSDDMIAASGLSQEYIDAMYPEDAGGSGGLDLVDSWHNWLAKQDTGDDKGNNNTGNNNTGGGGGNDKPNRSNYANWGAGEWNAYFAEIANSESREAAEDEYKELNSYGIIPDVYKSAAARGTMGSLGSYGSGRG